MDGATKFKSTLWGPLLPWMIATVIAMGLAGEAARRIVPAFIGQSDGAYLIVGTFIGLILGIGQGLLLRRYGVRLWAWMAATLIGVVAMSSWASLLAPDSSGTRVDLVDERGTVIRTWEGREV